MAPNDFEAALKSKTHQIKATIYDSVFSITQWRNFIPALILLVVVFGLQVLATAVPYRPPTAEQAGIEIVLNHRAGYPLDGVETSLEPSPNIVLGTRLILSVDDEILLDAIYFPRGSESRAQVFERFKINPGKHQVTLIMFDRENDASSQVLLDTLVDLNAGQILRLEYKDAHIGSDPAAGEKLYYETSLGTNASCRICHSLEPAEDLVGPSFFGVATRAAERVPGLSAEEYLRQSILEPNAYVVEGFPSGLMVPNLGETLTQAQIDDLVAFLLTMK